MRPAETFTNAMNLEQYRMDANHTAKRPTILASIGRRLAARLIDCAIAVLIFFIVKFCAGALSAYVPAVTPKAGFLSAFFAAFAYFLLADALPVQSTASVLRSTRRASAETVVWLSSTLYTVP